MTVRLYADHKRWQLEAVTVHLSHKKLHARDCEECETTGGKIDQIGLNIELAAPRDRREMPGPPDAGVRGDDGDAFGRNRVQSPCDQPQRERILSMNGTRHYDAAIIGAGCVRSSATCHG
jgi:hypothetical protein